ncbi:MAG: hypothetical protein ACREP8_14820 [Candidatus Binatia bacterium]
MKLIKNVCIASLIGLCALAFGSCSKSEDDRGPMEKAGKAVDQAVEKAQEQAGQAMEKTGEALKEGGEKMRESGEKARQ